jgi:hypothetical protein
MKNSKPSSRISVEFEEQHLSVLISALEVYSRLRSGQVGIALDEVYWDRNLSYDERQHIEGTVRYMAFPSNPKREYDGHGGFFDQYQNEYNENGNIIKESEDWVTKKNRPHLDHANSSFGVGCSEMKDGSTAFEIKKVLAQYLHYHRNNGFRDLMNVDGDGISHTYSGIPKPCVVGFKPQKEFPIPQKHQKKLNSFMENKSFEKMWDYIYEKVFDKSSLPQGSSYELKKINEHWNLVVNHPFKIKS